MEKTINLTKAIVLLLFTACMAFFLSCEKPDYSGSGVGLADDLKAMGDDRTGLLSGSYGLAGTFTADRTEIIVNTENRITAPGPVWYMSNSQRSIVGGHFLGSANKAPGRYMLKTEKAPEYEYLILWCEPFGVYIGGGRIPKIN